MLIHFSPPPPPPEFSDASLKQWSRDIYNYTYRLANALNRALCNLDTANITSLDVSRLTGDTVSFVAENTEAE